MRNSLGARFVPDISSILGVVIGLGAVLVLAVGYVLRRRLVA